MKRCSNHKAFRRTVPAVPRGQEIKVDRSNRLSRPAAEQATRDQPGDAATGIHHIAQAPFLPLPVPFSDQPNRLKVIIERIPYLVVYGSCALLDQTTGPSPRVLAKKRAIKRQRLYPVPWERPISSATPRVLQTGLVGDMLCFNVNRR